jgi:hypothetical protein
MPPLIAFNPIDEPWLDFVYKTSHFYRKPPRQFLVKNYAVAIVGNIRNARRSDIAHCEPYLTVRTYNFLLF